jgi:hypothetical protein
LLVMIFTAERSPFQGLVSLGVLLEYVLEEALMAMGAVGLLLAPLVLRAGHRREATSTARIGDCVAVS